MPGERAVQPLVPGMRLSEIFFRQAVEPLLRRHFAHLGYSAGLMGSGSEVLGFDDARSTDHHWGPRVMLFLRQEDVDRHIRDIHRLMATELPREVEGYPTNFTEPQEDGSQLLRYAADGPINHRVEVSTLPAYLMHYVGLSDPLHMLDLDWLVTPQQRLRTLAHGAVFHDGLHILDPMRQALQWYPDHIWRTLLAAQWRRIGQEEPFPGRCVEAGDELGSRVVTARLVRDLMLLAFLMERTYAPYSKWLGTGFSRLKCASVLTPHLTGALDSDTWEARENALVDAYRAVASIHNHLKLTPPLPTEPSPFHSRPFRVIHGEVFAEALSTTVDADIQDIVSRVGSVDQWVDSTDVLGYPERYRRTTRMYDLD